MVYVNEKRLYLVYSTGCSYIRDLVDYAYLNWFSCIDHLNYIGASDFITPYYNISVFLQIEKKAKIKEAQTVRLYSEISFIFCKLNYNSVIYCINVGNRDDSFRDGVDHHYELSSSNLIRIDTVFRDHTDVLDYVDDSRMGCNYGVSGDRAIIMATHRGMTKIYCNVRVVTYHLGYLALCGCGSSYGTYTLDCQNEVTVFPINLILVTKDCIVIKLNVVAVVFNVAYSRSFRDSCIS